jgi:cold shock protein
MTGFVKLFDHTRGFGFIIEFDTRAEYFFHHSDTLDKVVATDNVSFEVAPGKKGPKAIKVKRIK